MKGGSRESITEEGHKNQEGGSKESVIEDRNAD